MQGPRLQGLCVAGDQNFWFLDRYVAFFHQDSSPTTNAKLNFKHSISFIICLFFYALVCGLRKNLYTSSYIGCAVSKKKEHSFGGSKGTSPALGVSTDLHAPAIIKDLPTIGMICLFILSANGLGACRSVRKS